MPNWKKILVSGSDASLNTLVVSNGITGSLLGTASFAISSSRAVTASYALNGGVTQLFAGSNVTLSPTTGLGQVTISSTGAGTYYNTATGSYGAFYDTTTQTNPVANIPRSMSLNTTDITNGVSISGSSSPFNTYIKIENAGVYNIQFSAQLEKTDFGTDYIDIWLRRNGVDLTDSATKVTLSGINDKEVAAWNWFATAGIGDYYQIMWASADTNSRLLAESATGVHPGIPSVIVTVNRIDTFLSNTGSFTGSFTGVLIGTASYATQALSSSFATSALSSSFATTAISASFATSASFAISSSRAVTSSFAITASYVTGSIYTSTNPALSASFASTALSSSFATTSISASFASTASFVGNSLITASVSSNTITFTKGNGTTFPITVATGSGTVSNIATSGTVNGITLTGGPITTTGTITLGGTLSNVQSSQLATSSLMVGSTNIALGATASSLTGLTSVTSTAFTGSLFGTSSWATNATTATTATNATNVAVTDTTTGTGPYYIAFTDGTTGNRAVRVDSTALTFNATTNTLTNATFSGSLIGTASFASSSISASFATSALSSSFATTSISSSFASTASFVGNSIITASVSSNTITFTKGNGTTFPITVATGSATSAFPFTGSAIITGSLTVTGSLNVTTGITGSLLGTASFATSALSSSFATTSISSSFAASASFAISSSRAISSSFASTASFVNTLNQNVLITGSTTIASTTAGASENTLTLGPSPAGGTGEGGQLGLNAQGGTYTSASFIDNYQNQIRILRGSNAGSDGLVASWNLHTKQMQLPAYTAASSFVGTAAANLAVDSGGNVITVSTTGGSVFPYTGNAVITGSLTVTQPIYVPINGAMYFQGGDDAALYDINIVNTMGIYGVQDITRGAIKLGSDGPTLHGSGSRLGIGTITPTSASLTVDGNVWANSFTGSLLGTASWATNVVNNGVTSVATAGTVSGITLTGGTITSTGTITLGGSISGLTTSNLSATAGITNGQLANSSLMIGSTSIALGATASSITGLTSVTSTAFTGSLLGTASFATSALSSSFATTSISSSFASTASFVANDIITASVSSNTITFTKGNGTTFPITVATGSAIPAFPFTGSAIITGSLTVTGSLNVTTGITGSLLGTASYSLATNPAGSDFELQFKSGSVLGANSSFAIVTGLYPRLRINSTNNSGVQLLESSSPKWSIASYGGGIFTFYNDAINQEALGITAANIAKFGSRLLVAGGSDDATNALQVNGSAKITTVAVIGASAAAASAALDVTSTTRGFLKPRLTTTQKNAISSPATGLEVFDTTIVAPGFYNGSAWLSNVNTSGLTSNFLSRANSSTGLVNSIIQDNGSLVSISGSLTVTGSLIATSFTGSLLGTASFATSALSSSFATTASFALNGISGLTSNYIPKADSATTLGDSGMQDDSTNIIIDRTTIWQGKASMGALTPPVGGAVSYVSETDLLAYTGGQWTGEVISGTAGANITVGQLCYMNTAGRWRAANADNLAESSTLLGICLLSASGLGSTFMLLKGFVETTYSLGGTPGEPLYIEPGSGAGNGYVTPTVPTVTGQFVRIIGHTHNSTTIRFNPDNIWVEL